METQIYNFSDIPVEKYWSFSDKTIKDTSYITHGYYTYPAKFIPQIAEELIKTYSQKGDTIVDVFMGSGTTMVEGLILGRKIIGTDINEIAYLVSKVKTTILPTTELALAYNQIEQLLKIQESTEGQLYWQKAEQIAPQHERIDYWFKPATKKSLTYILAIIQDIENKDIKDFYLVVFCQILKTASIWLQKSVKPTRDLQKKDADVNKLFLTQAKKAIRKQIEFQTLLKTNLVLDVASSVLLQCEDARKVSCSINTAALVVTSPPYVTSYEYADLHQLPLLWLGHLNELMTYRKKFIGSSFKDVIKNELHSKTATNIISQLGNNKKSKEVETYFCDMYEVFTKCFSILKSTGKICIVIGNTNFKGVDILNAEVFAEQLTNIGFNISDVICREIPSKMLPSTRDKNTGHFAKTVETTMLVYPKEYILIAEKP